MSLLTVLIVLVLVGVVLWLINQYVPMQPSVKKILNIVVIIVLIIYLLRAFGVLNFLQEVKI